VLNCKKKLLFHYHTKYVRKYFCTLQPAHNSLRMESVKPNSSNRRNIAVVTGTRAEYGLLFWLLKAIQEDPELDLKLFATGMHLSTEFGKTVDLIRKDGFQISGEIQMDLDGDRSQDISHSFSKGLSGLTEQLEDCQPDITVLLGDRYEAFAAAIACMMVRVPIAHIHGGELTEGLIDDAIRHSITKMSHFHFVAADAYRKRVIQLGEQPDSVFNVGAIGRDQISKLSLLGRSDLEKEIGFKYGKVNFLITYHPVTLDKSGPKNSCEELLAALDQYPEAHIIFTRPNSEIGQREIVKLIDNYAEKNKNRVKVFTSLGQLKYLSAMKNSDIVIGNSSSGLIEAPALCKPTVNIGPRQRGRLEASSVITCEENRKSISASIKKALSVEFQKELEKISDPYGSGEVSNKIKDKLKNLNLDQILMKKFYDL